MSMTVTPGTSASAIGLSGMRAAQRQLDVQAHNIANLQTPGFQRQTLVQTAQHGLAGVNTEVKAGTTSQGEDGFAHLAEDLVGQRMSLYSFAANLKTVKAEEEMLGTLLDTRA